MIRVGSWDRGEALGEGRGETPKTVTIQTPKTWRENETTIVVSSGRIKEFGEGKGKQENEEEGGKDWKSRLNRLTALSA